MQSRFLIGAASSGSGKTTLTLGLLRAFVRRGLVVQPFKCGPDYIDPLYHRLAVGGTGLAASCAGCGRDSINLDLWMASEEHLRELFARHGADADVCVAEGAMGLFDGYRAAQGSSAEVARLLDLPVILVVDGRAAAYSVAPVLWGFRNFRGGEAQIAGVIFNRVGSESHYAMLAEAAHDAGVEPLGWLPRREDFVAPSRHLGLSLDGLDGFSPTIDAIADALERHVDLDRLLELTRRPLSSRCVQEERTDEVGATDDKPREQTMSSCATHRRTGLKNSAAASTLSALFSATWRETGGLRIAVARDEAFNFIYRANLDRLRELGGELHFFSPLHDVEPPAGTDLIYLPGGYPELFAHRLSQNSSMREAIRDYAERGGRLLAECGGMLYLCRTLTPAPGARPLPMCGVLPIDGTMEGMRLHLGYRELHLDSGMCLRGHEFHYSHIEGEEQPSVARQFSARGEEVSTPLYRYKNTIAGYTHLYWAEGDPMQMFV